GQIRASIAGPRLFPRVGTRWIFKLHEFPVNNRFRVVVTPSIRLLHDAYVVRQDARIERNLRILRGAMSGARDEADACHYGFFLARYPTEISGLSDSERVQILERCVVGGLPMIRVDAGELLTDLYLAQENWAALIEACNRLGSD